MLVQKGPFQNFDVNGLEERARRLDRRRVCIAFMGAVFLHGSTTLGLTFWTPPEPVEPPGEMMITIDLAPAVMSAAVDPTAGEVEAAPQPEQIAEPEPEPVEEPEEIVEPVPPEPTPPEPIEEKPEEVVQEEPTPEPVIEQEEIVEPPKAEKAEVVLPPKKPKKKEKPKPKPKPRKKTASAPQSAASAASKQRSEVGGSGARASASDMSKYIGRLRAALERKKRYPSAAGGASGTASLRFTVNRAGKVTGYTLTRSSGNAALDAATRDMIQNASLPPIPDGLPNSITIGVPVNFRVR